MRVICLYPSVEAGKMARRWFESAINNFSPNSSPKIEYFNYAVLNRHAICWEHVLNLISPAIILMVSDGIQILGAGLRHSLRELFANGRIKGRSLVVFRDLPPAPNINSRVLLDYVSALSHGNHCELNASSGNGAPLAAFRNQRLLLGTRRRHE